MDVTDMSMIVNMKTVEKLLVMNVYVAELLVGIIIRRQEKGLIGFLEKYSIIDVENIIRIKKRNHSIYHRTNIRCLN
jgi:hypothetical protein